jgi:folate-dependent phosphoribosylglycinamide formyltransferase PurN
MNVALLSYCGPFDRYLIDQVHRAHPLSKIIRPMWEPDPAAESAWTRLPKAPVTTLHGYVARRWNDCRQQRLDSALARLLDIDPDGSLPAPCVDVPANEINQPHVAELLKEANLDVVLVSCAPLMKPRIFNIPRLGTINVHRGISPFYRGQDTLFWPLYFRDYEQVGVTVHRIDRGTDTGPILAQGYLNLEPGDTLPQVTAKAARLAAVLVPDVLRRLQEGAAFGRPQREGGTQFRAKDRRPWHDLLYWSRRHLLQERLPRQSQRIGYPADPASSTGLCRQTAAGSAP